MQIPKFPLWICALTVLGGVMLHAQDNSAQAAARASLMQKMQELDSNPPAAPAPPPAVKPAAVAPVQVAPAVVVVPAEVVQVPVAPPAATVQTQTPIMPAGDNAAQSGGTTSPAAPAPVAAAPAKIQAKPAAAAEAPSAAPAPPINMTKQQTLEWLLSLYKADKLTPQQYHEQRAAILAAP